MGFFAIIRARVKNLFSNPAQHIGKERILMKKMSSVKTACICAICIALCYVLPVAFHTLNLGGVFSPLHIPVLLCGLICGGFYGAFCGIAGPILSSVLSGMMMKRIRTGKLYADLYLSLGCAMILGRVVGGIAKAVFLALMATGEPFTLALWVSSYFVGSMPGIVAHLVVLPTLVVILMKAKLIPSRY